MGPETLAQVLRPLHNMFKKTDYPAMLVGLDEADDAAVYKINDETAVIQTVDFFAPVVDDPFEYGAIAAANAMSDVYAMGGEVVLALNICGFPTTLPVDTISEILRGGALKVREAGGVLAGGHTVEDKEPKYGLAVMGLIHPDKLLTTAGARAGDALLLTKPLGVGIITTAAKGDMATPTHVAAAVESMSRLNRGAVRILDHFTVHACTDVTGFAVIGAAWEMAEGSRALLRFHHRCLPFLDGARDYAGQWLFPGGTCRNQRAYERHVRFTGNVEEELRQLLYTPETSGGLLVAVPGDQADSALTMFNDSGEPCWLVGEVTDGLGVEILD